MCMHIINFIARKSNFYRLNRFTLRTLNKHVFAKKNCIKCANLRLEIAPISGQAIISQSSCIPISSVFFFWPRRPQFDSDPIWQNLLKTGKWGERLQSKRFSVYTHTSDQSMTLHPWLPPGFYKQKNKDK